MNGFEVIAALKGNPETKRIPAVLVSAIADSSARARGAIAGADDSIAKPIDRASLVSRVKQILRATYDDFVDADPRPARAPSP